MELDLTTFILEIVNFLILVWLLSRFFFKPVVRIIDRRREDIKKNIEEAEAARGDAGKLREKYESRLAEWEDEKSVERRKLHEDIRKEREQLMDELKKELEEEREKEAILNQRRLDKEKQNRERLALRQGAAFSARLLSRLASPELEEAIIRLFLDQLARLAPELKESVKTDQGDNSTGISIYSAYPLAAATQEQIENSLGDITGTGVQCHYRRDPSLIAGLRVAIGSHLIEATIKDELKYFSGEDHGGK